MKLKRGDTSKFSRGYGSESEVLHDDNDYTVNLLYGFLDVRTGDVNQTLAGYLQGEWHCPLRYDFFRRKDRLHFALMNSFNIERKLTCIFCDPMNCTSRGTGLCLAHDATVCCPFRTKMFAYINLLHGYPPRTW